MNNPFIVLEGPDGAGTTTHVRLLAQHIQKLGKAVFLTAEPSGGPIGRFIREELKTGTIPPLALQTLFTADRAWHIEKQIKPALDEGKIVICDRYALSTIVYAEALGIDADPLAYMNKKFIQPDIELLLLPPLSVCQERLGKRVLKESLEEESLQKRVYELYEEAAALRRMPVIDTSGNPDTVAQTILKEAGF